MVSRLVEEILNSADMEEAKRKIAIVIEETINVIQRDEDFMADSFDRGRKQRSYDWKVKSSSQGYS